MNRGQLSYRAFIDTGAYFALAAARDRRHQEAAAINTRLTDEHWRLFTTNFILAETHALLLARAGRSLARKVLSELRASAATTIIRITPSDELEAWGIIDRYDDKNFSFTDATSFVIMERLGVHDAFTFDRNFAQYGFIELPSPPH